jgi:alkylhydroperoxidase/carboxymuconolactone decarboxylase family protein YurZ
MEERMSYLFAFAKAVATRETEQFAQLIKAAYQAGATREDLLTAVEIGRMFGEPSRTVLAEAYATIHAWQWIAVRSLFGTGELKECPSGGDHE